MKISSVQNISLINQLQNKNNKQNKNNIKTHESPIFFSNVNLPTTSQYLSFMGGYSLNLAQTVEKLDAHALKNPQIYPPNIREFIGMVLEEGNKAKNTLIDVHKKYFSSLEECTTLSEIKSRFKEFKDVISSEDVEIKEGSFIDRFKKGEFEYFDKDEDLSVQLIKLYWGDGFSLPDLKKYTDGLDLYHTLLKLNIPRSSQSYGHILKLSDAEYNSRLVKEMAEKRLAALDRKAQLQDGEPVYIPKKHRHLAFETRKRISDSLIKYYEENPEATYRMSERQKEFFRENPEQAEMFSRVSKRAWCIFGADRIKSAMSKFMSSKGFKNFDVTKSPVDMTKPEMSAMEMFWGQNEWARKAFSKNMKHAWKQIHAENAISYSLPSVPTQLGNLIEKLEGYPEGSLDFTTKFNPFTKKSSIDENVNEIFNKHEKEIEDLADIMADTFQIGVFTLARKIDELKLDKLKNYKELKDRAKLIITLNVKPDGSYRGQSTSEAREDFLFLTTEIFRLRCLKAEPLIQESLDEAFEVACKFHKSDILN